MSFIFFTKAYSIKPLIYLDPGHGGLDFGAVIKKPRMVEKKYCLTTAHYTKRCLEKMGYRVSLTRSRDFFVPLKRRTFVANRARAGIFVSLHFNSCPNKQAHGIEIYYYDGKNNRAGISRLLARCILNRMIFRTKAKPRGVKKGKYLVIRETKMPSILIEGGFLTNISERNNVRKREYLMKIARGIAEGIDRFVKRKK